MIQANRQGNRIQPKSVQCGISAQIIVINLKAGRYRFVSS